MAENPYAATRTPLERSSSKSTDLHLASRFKRLVARLVDGIVVGLVSWTFLVLIMGTEWYVDQMYAYPVDLIGLFAPDFSLFMFGSLFLGLLITFLVQGYLLHQYGQTVGKRLLSIKIVEEESGKKPTLARTFVIRECGMNVFGLIPLGGLVDILFIFGAPRKCIHDYWSKTLVVDA